MIIILDRTSVVVESPSVAGVAVWQDFEGGRICSRKDSAKVVDIPCIAGIPIVENLKSRDIDILHYQAIEDDICSADDVCEIWIWDWRNEWSLYPGRHGTKMWRRRSRTRGTISSTYSRTRCTMDRLTRTVVIMMTMIAWMIIVVGLATVARFMIIVRFAPIARFM